MKTYYDIYVISSAGAIIKRFNAGTDFESASHAMYHLAKACPSIYPLANNLKLIGICDREVTTTRYRKV